MKKLKPITTSFADIFKDFQAPPDGYKSAKQIKDELNIPISEAGVNYRLKSQMEKGLVDGIKLKGTAGHLTWYFKVKNNANTKKTENSGL